jgi:hypothetical protein
MHEGLLPRNDPPIDQKFLYIRETECDSLMRPCLFPTASAFQCRTGKLRLEKAERRSMIMNWIEAFRADDLPLVQIFMKSRQVGNRKWTDFVAVECLHASNSLGQSSLPDHFVEKAEFGECPLACRRSWGGYFMSEGEPDGGFAFTSRFSKSSQRTAQSGRTQMRILT